VLIVPDRLTLAEVLEQFRMVHEDFAVIVNEYSLVVGVVTLNDVMSTVMGDLVGPADEEQIIRRDEHSWLIDGITPIEDVMRVLHLDDMPHDDEYETLAGFLMVMLRRVPRRTDAVIWGGYKFEVLDVDSYRIDQVMVTQLPEPAAESAAPSAAAAAKVQGSAAQAQAAKAATPESGASCAYPKGLQVLFLLKPMKRER
jgi:CBS domain containing-hemolysin-like protein